MLHRITSPGIKMRILLWCLCFSSGLQKYGASIFLLLLPQLPVYQALSKSDLRPTKWMLQSVAQKIRFSSKKHVWWRIMRHFVSVPWHVMFCGTSLWSVCEWLVCCFVWLCLVSLIWFCVLCCTVLVLASLALPAPACSALHWFIHVHLFPILRRVLSRTAAIQSYTSCYVRVPVVPHKAVAEGSKIGNL